MIAVSMVTIDAEVEESVLRTLRSGFVSQGARVAELEEQFAAMTEVRNAVAVNNGTTALVATLEALGIGPGDEVVTSAFTFVATVNAILHVGATARVVDICEHDFAVDPEAVAADVTRRTAALMPVHLYGQTADLGQLEPIARRHGLYLVEDSAQAHGARFAGRPAGSFGTGCFSFYSTKNLVAGEGGIITTDDDYLADRLRLLRNQGMRKQYDYELVGHNYRMSDLLAAVVLPQLGDHYAEQVRRRQANARVLTERLDGLPGLILPRVQPGREHVWHQYTVRLEGDVPRDVVAARLAAQGVGSGIYYPLPVHRCRTYQAHPRVRASSTPVADRVAATCLSLPVHSALSHNEVDRVADAVRNSLR
jgi:perosamine synthetase